MTIITEENSTKI